MNGGTYRAHHICPHCQYNHEGSKSVKSAPETTESAQAEPLETAAEQTAAEPEVVTAEAEAPSAAPQTAESAPTVTAEQSVTLTSKPKQEQTVLTDLNEVSAECTLSIALTPDLFENKKFVGQKSKKVLAALQQGKDNAIAQLRQAAQSQGANMVTDVSVKNSMKMVSKSSANITINATGNAIVAEADEACAV